MKQIPSIASLILFLTACAPPEGAPRKPKTHDLEVTARFTDGVLKIDKKQKHEKPTLDRGDKIAWSCDCPEGAQFAVRNVRHLAIGKKSDDELDALLETVGAGLDVARPPYDPGDPFLGKVDAGFTDGDATIDSRPYRWFEDEHEWKFDWVVRVRSDGVWLEEDWDPHFSGNRGK